MRRWLGSPFREPSGILGKIGARFMARAGRPMHRFAIDVLDPQPGEHFLEIGPAHGALMEMLLELDGVHVSAVEPSGDMVNMASRRNRDAVEEGRAEVRQGTVSEIPFDDAVFDGAVTTNTVYFWPDLDADLREIARVLRPGGRLVIGFRAAPGDHAWFVATNGGANRPGDLSIDDLAAAVAGNGFRDVSKQLRHFTKRALFGRFSAGVVAATRE